MPRHESNFERRDDFKRRLRDIGHDRFTMLIKTPKEILAMESGKGTFTAMPPMSGDSKARKKNTYCDFHGDKWNNTDDCLHLKRQIEKVGFDGTSVQQNSWQSRDTCFGRSPDYHAWDDEISNKERISYNRKRKRKAAINLDGSPTSYPSRDKNINVAIHLEYLEQSIMLGGGLANKGKNAICEQKLRIKKELIRSDKRKEMAKEDVEKTGFHTSQWVFSYTKMPFGFKNVRDTYERLVDKAFKKQIGRNLKVYVDDLVIKSYNENESIRDIEETSAHYER
uniref:Reverse transcriptase domain-containing protein n=1 Tax=Tanacetum cinerariifolium TaxID=118510 RepID=A0A699HYC8_TANCI|nr:reverse transcriptase domain-containing protein [Tanacetum cinerariifolium]